MYIILVPVFIVFLLNFVFLLIIMHREYKEYTGQMSVDELKSNYGDLNKGLKYAINATKIEIATEFIGHLLFYVILPSFIILYYFNKRKINKEYFKRIEEMIWV